MYDLRMHVCVNVCVYGIKVNTQAALGFNRMGTTFLPYLLFALFWLRDPLVVEIIYCPFTFLCPDVRSYTCVALTAMWSFPPSFFRPFKRFFICFLLCVCIGYVQSLIRRVVNNVNIVVNNLILKYVEDDIVLSVNITSAECYTVDDIWERAFMDITGEQWLLTFLASGIN